jgi:hypothetical protein
LEGTGALFTSFKKITGEFSFTERKFKLKMKNEKN